MIVVDILLAFVLILVFAFVGAVLAYAFQRIGDAILDKIGGW